MPQRWVLGIALEKGAPKRKRRTKHSTFEERERRKDQKQTLPHRVLEGLQTSFMIFRGKFDREHTIIP